MVYQRPWTRPTWVGEPFDRREGNIDAKRNERRLARRRVRVYSQGMWRAFRQCLKDVNVDVDVYPISSRKP